MTKRPDEAALAPYVVRLHELAFVRDVTMAGQPDREESPHGLLKIRTRRRTYTFTPLIRRTFLDRTLTNAIIAEHTVLRRKHGAPLLLLARYVPRPTGERLVAAGVSFVDRPGNIHLTLGDDHHVLLLGRREPASEATARRPGPALIQLYFLLLAEPTALGWSVRRLADEAGVGKTAAATVLQRLVGAGVLAESRAGGYAIVNRQRLIEDFLRGYTDVLRPRLEIGRFRGPESDPEKFLGQVVEAADKVKVPWAATGGAAAHALDRFYRGGDVSLFVDGTRQTLALLLRELRLVPDREGPVTLLRAFGRRWASHIAAGQPVAHPWLVYAELLHLGEPRAIEAAAHIRDRFLTT